MGKFLEALGAVALAAAGAVAEAEKQEIRRKQENMSIGIISIPYDEMRKIAGRRIVLEATPGNFGEVRKLDPSEWIQSKWLIWGARFRVYSGYESIKKVEITSVAINAGESVPCRYLADKGWQYGYVTIMESSR